MVPLAPLHTNTSNRSPTCLLLTTNASYYPQLLLLICWEQHIVSTHTISTLFQRAVCLRKFEYLNRLLCRYTRALASSAGTSGSLSLSPPAVAGRTTAASTSVRSKKTGASSVGISGSRRCFAARGKKGAGSQKAAAQGEEGSPGDSSSSKAKTKL